MSAQAQQGSFLLGLAGGMLIGFAVALIPVLWLGVDSTVSLYAAVQPTLKQLWILVDTNLQGSVIPFLLILAMYWVQLGTLRGLLARPDPRLDQVVRHEQLLELCANLFFGVGVIWTAIGMRDALLYALGDPGVSASVGAFAVLQRLVDGGILLALSTTIVGGLGGYLMRAVKSLSLGSALNALYYRASQEPAEESLAALQRIEGLLHSGEEKIDRAG